MSFQLSTSSFGFISALAAIVVAIASSLRARRGVAEWSFLVALCLLAVDRCYSAFSLQAASLGAVERWQQWRMAIFAATPGAWLVFSLAFARTNAKTFLGKWRYIWPTAILVPTLLAIVFRREFFTSLQGDGDNRWILGLSWMATAVHVLVLVISVFVLVNFERTYRASVGVLRWRIKFMLLGAAIVFVTSIYTTTHAILYRSIGATAETINSVAVLLGVVLMGKSLLRMSRFDLEVYPSQSFLEGSVIVVLASVYLFGIGVLAKVVNWLGGDSAFELKALTLLIALVLLAVLFQSDRMRLYVRRSVSRHFQRSVYDYRAIWRKFSDSTAACVEQADLCRSIVRTTAEIFQSLNVSVWLLDDRRDSLYLAASTSVSDAKGREVAPNAMETQVLINHFERHADGVDIEKSEGDWAEILRRCHPTDFPNGGNRICVPLLKQRQLVGVLVLGDRVSGVAFPMQDFDLLKCIGEHATASLLNIQMSRQLLQAKEFEAFQTMATFFVHDLKNAASTLNLMLQNLPVHFDNPEFRADALRAIAKTVNHINRLTGRLGMLRHELKIQPTVRDLNEIVVAALADHKIASPSTISRELGELAPTLLDQEQLQKVITNLVLNATEAIPADGHIRVATTQENGWVVLTVADNGCGMTEEFLQRSLFRPFQTTKQHGLGIGMFQSRMIVEAHGGRIHVTSKQGQGSTFQIFLPVRTPSE